MKQVIQPAGEYQLSAGVFHDFTDLPAIFRVIAMAGAALAGGFGLQGAERTLDVGMGHQFLAGFT